MIETTDGYTVCSCNHLTHFGVLFDARGTSSRVNGSEKSVPLSTCCNAVLVGKWPQDSFTSHHLRGRSHITTIVISNHNLLPCVEV